MQTPLHSSTTLTRWKARAAERRDRLQQVLADLPNDAARAKARLLFLRRTINVSQVAVIGTRLVSNTSLACKRFSRTRCGKAYSRAIASAHRPARPARENPSSWVDHPAFAADSFARSPAVSRARLSFGNAVEMALRSNAINWTPVMFENASVRDSTSITARSKPRTP